MSQAESKIVYRPELLPGVVCDVHPEWVALHELAMRTAINNIEYPVQPGWLPQLTCMPGQGFIWQWDSCFMTFFARYANGLLPAMNNLDNLYRLQRDDGYISMAYDMSTDREAYGERINPPLYAWAEWEYFQVTGDDSRFVRVLPVLERFYQWVRANRRRPDSDLYWFEDSGSSGMDNAPRGGYIAAHGDGSDICYIDLACQQALSARCLARIADRLGEEALELCYREEHRALAELINERHWCQRTGFYYDLFSRSSRELRMNFLNHKTAAGFWPILSGVAGPAQINRLAEHLLDPAEFWTLHPVPTLSKDDPNYDPFGGYWLGGVWAPTNYMIARGLQQAGWHALAREIAVKHLAAMAAVMRDESFGSIWEAYAPDHCQPSHHKELGGLVRPNFVGWSGLGPLAMLIEQVFGLQFDAEANAVSWDIRTTGDHGVTNLRFNGGTLSLLCDGFHPDGRQTEVHVTTNRALTLNLMIANQREESFPLEPGEHRLVK